MRRFAHVVALPDPKSDDFLQPNGIIFCRLGWKNTVRGAVVARVEIDRGGLVRGSFETH
jgi:hypothetical protein